MAAEVRDSTGLRFLVFGLEHAPAHSAALITVEMSEAFPPAGDRALEVALVGVVVFTAAAVDAAVDDIGDCMHPNVEVFENSRMEKTSCPRNI